MPESLKTPELTPVQKILKSIDELCVSIGVTPTEYEIDDTRIVFSLHRTSEKDTYRSLAAGIKSALTFDYQMKNETEVIPNEWSGFDIVVYL